MRRLVQRLLRERMAMKEMNTNCLFGVVSFKMSLLGLYVQLHRLFSIGYHFL